jgi:hypothetical protein
MTLHHIGYLLICASSLGLYTITTTGAKEQAAQPQVVASKGKDQPITKGQALHINASHYVRVAPVGNVQPTTGHIPPTARISPVSKAMAYYAIMMPANTRCNYHHLSTLV